MGGVVSQPDPGPGLSHLDETGAARMVDVSAKPETERVAVAGCRVLLAPATLELLAAAVTGNQGSGVLSSCVAADGLAVVPASRRELPAGSPVQVVLLREDLAWVS